MDARRNFCRGGGGGSPKKAPIMEKKSSKKAPIKKQRSNMASIIHMEK